MNNMTTSNPLHQTSCIGKGSKERYSLRLYVAGAASASRRAIENVTSLCETRLSGQYELETIDIYQQPELARTAGIIAVPTLVKMAPPPERRLIGDMSSTDRVVWGLGLRLQPSL